MSVVYSIRASRNTQWYVTINRWVVCRQLKLAPAIKLARQLAREEHAASGRTVFVELATENLSILLAHYPREAAEFSGTDMMSAVA